MKKQTCLLSILFLFFLASCKKDFTCSCAGEGLSYEYKLIDSKKNAAKTVCEGKGIGGREVDGVLVEKEAITCQLK